MISGGFQRYSQIFMKRADIGVRDQQARKFNLWLARRRAKQPVRNNFCANARVAANCAYYVAIV